MDINKAENSINDATSSLKSSNGCSNFLNEVEGNSTIFAKSVKDEKKSYTCDSCQKTFNLKQSLTNHIIQVHENRKDYQCVSCEKRFSLLNSLKTHYRKVH